MTTTCFAHPSRWCAHTPPDDLQALHQCVNAFSIRETHHDIRIHYFNFSSSLPVQELSDWHWRVQIPEQQQSDIGSISHVDANVALAKFQVLSFVADQSASPNII